MTPSEQRKRPQSLLFACTFNAVRSPMAEAIARKRYGREVYIQSVGVKAGELDGFAVTVMDEIGLDISGHAPRTFAELEDTAFDMIVSLSPEAHHTALEFTRTMAVETLYWPTIDPSAFQGSREIVLAAYRDVRDTLEHKIRKMLGADTSGMHGADI